MTGMSYFLAISYTAFRLAMETGCPGGVAGDGADDVGHVGGARLQDGLFQLHQIEVAFEVGGDRGIERLPGVDVLRHAAVDLGVALGGVEEVVGEGHHLLAIQPFSCSRFLMSTGM